MASIRVVMRHGEAIVRPDQPELWVQGEKISPGEEKSYEVHVGEPFNVEAMLTEEMEKQAQEVEEADAKVAEENEKIRQENQKKAEEQRKKHEWRLEQERARRENREPDRSKEWKPPEEPAKTGEPGEVTGFAASPAPKVEPPPKTAESRAGVDSKEVKSEAPLKK